MKGSQAIHRRLSEEHEPISAKSGLLPAGLLTRSDPDEIGRDLPRMLSVPPESWVYVTPLETPAPTLRAPEAPVAKAPARTFPYHEFASSLDPAVVKARYLVGPIDPLILFVGDLDERHAPDLLICAMPPILKKHPQARLVIVGDGELLWPLKVMSRYMLLDHAVRIAGHVGGRDVRELIAAADIMAIPSREQTEDWQILSGWSARKPVVVTPAGSNGLCMHEENGLLVDSEPAALVVAFDRVLSDPQFGRRVAENGYRKVLDEFAGEPSMTERLSA
jgi:glycosyltransferase involved in cell wall biosynthesis